MPRLKPWIICCPVSIIVEAVAHRPKDLLDIQGIIQRHPDLDRRRIRSWVTQFADLLDRPELWDAMADWL